MKKPPRKTTPETRIKRAVKSALNTCGVFNYPILQGLGAYKGIPDIIAHYGGRVIYLEIKNEKGRLSENQKAFAAQCDRDGIAYLVIRSVDDLIEGLGLPLKRIRNNA